MLEELRKINEQILEMTNQEKNLDKKTLEETLKVITELDLNVHLLNMNMLTIKQRYFCEHKIKVIEDDEVYGERTWKCNICGYTKTEKYGG